MKWERKSIILSCGCAGAGAWEDLWVGAEQYCTEHGEQSIVRMSRVYEATPSRNFSLGVSETPSVEVGDAPVPQPPG